MFRMDQAICFSQTNHMDLSNHPMMGVGVQEIELCLGMKYCIDEAL